MQRRLKLQNNFNMKKQAADHNLRIGCLFLVKTSRLNYSSTDAAGVSGSFTVLLSLSVMLMET